MGALGTFTAPSAHLRQRKMQLGTTQKRRNRRCRERAACPPRRLRTRWRVRRRFRYKLPRQDRSSSTPPSLQRYESVSPSSNKVGKKDAQSSAKNGPEAVHSSAEMQSFFSERYSPTSHVSALPSPFLLQLASPASQGVQVLSTRKGENVNRSAVPFRRLTAAEKAHLGSPTVQRGTFPQERKCQSPPLSTDALRARRISVGLDQSRWVRSGQRRAGHRRCACRS